MQLLLFKDANFTQRNKTIMQVLLLSDSDSPHTLRWAKSLFNKGIGIGIFSLHKPNPELYKDCPSIKLFSLNVTRQIQNKTETSLSKLVYFKAINEVKKAIKLFKPDIVHAHYASSYGFLGSLTKFHPFIISVWGADIYNFPQKTILHFLMIKYSLSKADQILSTSNVMKYEIKKYTKKKISVTPFGIQLNKFYRQNVVNSFGPNNIVIGTVKTLENKYGIEFLIRAFKRVKDTLPNIPIKLLIVGGGSLAERLKSLVSELGLSHDTIFTGYIENSVIEKYHNMLDIAVYPSIEDSESFGVSVIESSACERPVIVSNVGGLPEVVADGKTGIVVEKENTNQLAEAIIKLIHNPKLRIEMGINGRKKVIEEYNWISSVELMLLHYNEMLKSRSQNEKP